MRITRNLWLSLRALSTHRVRTALAIGGTAVGVAGVLLLTAIGEGARAAVMRKIEGLGRNMLVVTAGKVESRAGRTLTGEGWTRQLRVEDAAAIEETSRHVVRAAPGQDRGMLAKFGSIQNHTTGLGTTPEWQQIRQFPLAEGRFFTEEENLARDRVAVLGWAGLGHANESLSRFGSAGGKHYRIGPVPFEVVGVLASKGMSVDGSATEDDRIIVPIVTALRRLFNGRNRCHPQARLRQRPALRGTAPGVLGYTGDERHHRPADRTSDRSHALGNQGQYCCQDFRPGPLRAAPGRGPRARCNAVGFRSGGPAAGATDGCAATSDPG